MPFVTADFIAALNDGDSHAEKDDASDMGDITRDDGVKRYTDTDIGIGKINEDEEDRAKETETCDPSEPCPSAAHVRRVFARSCGGFSGMVCISSISSSMISSLSCRCTLLCGSSGHRSDENVALLVRVSTFSYMPNTVCSLRLCTDMAPFGGDVYFNGCFSGRHDTVSTSYFFVPVRPTVIIM